MGTTAFALPEKNSSQKDHGRPTLATSAADAECQSGPIQGAHGEAAVTAGVISSARGLGLLHNQTSN